MSEAGSVPMRITMTAAAAVILGLVGSGLLGCSDAEQGVTQAELQRKIERAEQGARQEVWLKAERRIEVAYESGRQKGRREVLYDLEVNGGSGWFAVRVKDGMPTGEPSVKITDNDAPYLCEWGSSELCVMKADPPPDSYYDASDSPDYGYPESEGYYPDDPPTTENYGSGSGYDVICEDGTLSDSGGIQGACSHHGGVAGVP